MANKNLLANPFKLPSEKDNLTNWNRSSIYNIPVIKHSDTNFIKRETGQSVNDFMKSQVQQKNNGGIFNDILTTIAAPFIAVEGIIGGVGKDIREEFTQGKIEPFYDPLVNGFKYLQKSYSQGSFNSGFHMFEDISGQYSEMDKWSPVAKTFMGIGGDILAMGPFGIAMAGAKVAGEAVATGVRAAATSILESEAPQVVKGIAKNFHEIASGLDIAKNSNNPLIRSVAKSKIKIDNLNAKLFQYGKNLSVNGLQKLSEITGISTKNQRIMKQAALELKHHTSQFAQRVVDNTLDKEDREIVNVLLENDKRNSLTPFDNDEKEFIKNGKNLSREQLLNLKMKITAHLKTQLIAELEAPIKNQTSNLEKMRESYFNQYKKGYGMIMHTNNKDEEFFSNFYNSLDLISGEKGSSRYISDLSSTNKSKVLNLTKSQRKGLDKFYKIHSSKEDPLNVNSLKNDSYAPDMIVGNKKRQTILKNFHKNIKSYLRNINNILKKFKNKDEILKIYKEDKKLSKNISEKEYLDRVDVIESKLKDFQEQLNNLGGILSENNFKNVLEGKYSLNEKDKVFKNLKEIINRKNVSEIELKSFINKRDTELLGKVFNKDVEKIFMSDLKENEFNLKRIDKELEKLSTKIENTFNKELYHVVGYNEVFNRNHLLPSREYQTISEKNSLIATKNNTLNEMINANRRGLYAGNSYATSKGYSHAGIDQLSYFNHSLTKTGKNFFSENDLTNFIHSNMKSSTIKTLVSDRRIYGTLMDKEITFGTDEKFVKEAFETLFNFDMIENMQRTFNIQDRFMKMSHIMADAQDDTIKIIEPDSQEAEYIRNPKSGMPTTMINYSIVSMGDFNKMLDNSLKYATEEESTRVRNQWFEYTHEEIKPIEENVSETEKTTPQEEIGKKQRKEYQRKYYSEDKAFLMHNRVKDAFENNTFSDEDTHVIMNFLNKLIQKWKLLSILTPGFILRIFVGNVANFKMTNGHVPLLKYITYYSKANRILKRINDIYAREETTKAMNKMLSTKLVNNKWDDFHNAIKGSLTDEKDIEAWETYGDAVKNNLINFGGTTDRLGGMGDQLMDASILNKLRTNKTFEWVGNQKNKFLNWNHRMVSYIDDGNKIAQFMLFRDNPKWIRKALGNEIHDEYLKQGASIDFMSQKAAKVSSFDYSELTPFEKNVMRKWVPFYTWFRKNLGLQVGNMMKNLGYAKLMQDVINAPFNMGLAQNMTLSEIENHYLPIKVGNNVLMLKINLPIEDMQTIFSTNILGRLNPLVGGLYTLLSGKDLSTGYTANIEGTFIPSAVRNALNESMYELHVNNQHFDKLTGTRPASWLNSNSMFKIDNAEQNYNKNLKNYLYWGENQLSLSKKYQYEKMNYTLKDLVEHPRKLKKVKLMKI